MHMQAKQAEMLGVSEANNHMGLNRMQDISNDFHACIYIKFSTMSTYSFGQNTIIMHRLDKSASIWNSS
uniref:Uncharacterized protein n=1 Tax=Arundo donax TaxID=35708 RepID=A0A0A9GTK3_ARUDO